MVFVNRHVLLNSNSMLFWGGIVSFLLLFKIGKISAFLDCSLHPRAFIMNANGRYFTDSFSILKIADKSNVIKVTDLNYRELFRGEKLLLLEAFAQW